MALKVELLIPERVTMLWNELEPLLAQSCASNPIGAADISAQDIYNATQTNQAVLFAASDNGKVTTVLAIQFHMVNGKKGVDMIGLAGKNLLKFKAAFWEPILDWLRANEVVFVDAYATPELARMYMKKFGFTKSCAYVRMELQGD